MASAKFYGTGRRKKSVARVYLTPGTGKITINKRDIDEYFGLETLKLIVRQPLVATETADKYDVLVNVHGGGTTGQAGAVRLGIARALLKKASILVLDEPSGAFDVFSQNEFYHIFDEISKDKIVIFITHKLSYLKCMDNIYVIDDGCIVEEGTHDELLRSQGLYKKMYLAEGEHK